MVAYLLFFYVNANSTGKPHFCVKKEIKTLNFSHADEASEAN